MKEGNVSEKVQEFYTETPFPDYTLDRFNSKEDLTIAAYPFAEVLDRSIPANASVIDIGTGTGQLAAYLSLRRNKVFGIDFSENSLKKAAELKQKLMLDTLHLKKVDILNESQIDRIGMKFDYVLCFGVLHHTGNPYKAFRNILKLLKPEGHIAIGLYNKYGRIPLRMRRFLLTRVFRNNEPLKESFIKMQVNGTEDKGRVRSWWKDQYAHPHETSHTLGEVLRWFKENDIEYYQTIPSSTPFNQDLLEISGVWNKTNEIYPYLPIRVYKQFTWIWKIHYEGGYWITFGRRKK